MRDGSAENLLALSRDVERASTLLARWREDLASDAAGHAGEAPLEPVRGVAGKSTWDALAAFSPGAADAALRDALRPWVFALTLARIGAPDEQAVAEVMSEARGRLGGESPRLVSWRDAWRGVAQARSPALAETWLAAAAEAAPAVAAAAGRSAARRLEAARRLGVDHPWEGLLAVRRADLLGAADRLLDATEDVARAARRESTGANAGAAAVIHDAVAREAGDGWPPRPSPAWFVDVFGPGVRALPLRLPSPPAPLGAASFARALYSFGVAVRLASTPASMPFALARAPAFVGAHRLGCVFAALAADPSWQGHALRVSRRVATAQARTLARSLLLDTRLHAVRILLADDASPVGHRLDELGSRLFGSELDARFRGAWPAARDDEPARLLALLQARAFADALRDRFDADWYRNPRAWSFLRAAGAGGAHEPVDAASLAGAAESTARWFEEALG